MSFYNSAPPLSKSALALKTPSQGSLSAIAIFHQLGHRRIQTDFDK
jgi:hypothetical protein